VRSGGQLDERTFASSRAFPWIGAALGALIAAVLGWISALGQLPEDTLANHVKAALVFLLAATPWCFREARRAPNTPVTAAVRLSLFTYALGIPATLLCALAFAPLSHPSTAWTPESETAGLTPDFNGAILFAAPLIVAGAFSWCAAMLVFGPATAVRLGAVAVAVRERRVALLRLGASAAAAMLLVAPSFAYLRPYVAPLPDPPLAHRPAVVGIVKSYDHTTYGVGLEDGSTLNLRSTPLLPSNWSVQPGALLLVGKDNAWYAALRPDANGTVPSSTWDPSRRGDYAWDRDGYVLFANGLELPKAPDFTSFDEPFQSSSDRLWLPHKGFARNHVNERGEVAARTLDLAG
jgi:hypothetical protein